MKLLFQTLVAFLLCCQLSAQRTILHCGRLIDGLNDQVQTQMTVVVDSNRITAVEQGYRKPAAGDQVIDLKNQTVMPGLMDMHVHIENETSKKRYEESFRMNEADVALRATTYARKTLMAGFTTVRDLGGNGVNVSMRNAINKGYVTGPRIYTSEKSLATTGGQDDPTNGVRRDLIGDPGPKESQ